MLRITAGQLKGRILLTPKQIRATEAKVRLALFNVLGSFIEGARVLDGFAGSGAVGIEALSRGAGFVAFVESDTEAVLNIRDNLNHFASEIPRSSYRIVHMETERGLRQLARSEVQFHLAFFDPPYHSEEGKKALNTVVECAMLAPAGLVVIEHERRSALPASVGPLQQWKQHRYGETVLSFYRLGS